MSALASSAAVLVTPSEAASLATVDQLELGVLVMGLLGGLALFLYGMDKLATALRLVAGDRMKGFLARMTTNRLKGVLAGALITASIQSSSVTTVLVVGFISAGLLSLSQSVGIIMGAEIGTTLTAQIIAFRIDRYSLVLLAAGFFLEFLARKARFRHYGSVLMGLGFIFFGMQMMKEAMSPLVGYPAFVSVMQNLENPIVAVVFSAVFTALVQSSSATTGVIIALASQGLLTLESGIALVFGANIGTCMTAYLASIGKPREAVRAAAVHILFNVSGVALWLGLIPVLADFVRSISPVADGLMGIAKLEAETPRQIANAHTAFNVANTLLFIGFTPLIVRVVERLVPEQPVASPKRTRRSALDDILLHSPTLALDVVRGEISDLGKETLELVRSAVEPVMTGSFAALEDLSGRDSQVDEMHADLVSYLARLSAIDLSPEQSERLSRYIAAANYLENTGDMVETNLVSIGRRRLDEGVPFSHPTQLLMRQLHERVVWCLERALVSFGLEDADAAREVVEAKSGINALSERIESQIARRLSAQESYRVDVFRLEVELIEALRRIYYFAKRVAKLTLEEPSHYRLATDPSPNGSEEQNEEDLNQGALAGDDVSPGSETSSPGPP